MEITPHPLIKTMSGKVFGHREKISMRIQYGKVRSYTYQNKPEWTAAQIAYRQLFGASVYIGYLILKIDAAKEHYEAIRRREKFARTENYVAQQVRNLCEENAELRAQVIAANEAHKKVKGQKAKDEALKQEQMALAEMVWREMGES